LECSKENILQNILEYSKLYYHDVNYSCFCAEVCPFLKEGLFVARFNLQKCKNDKHIKSICHGCCHEIIGQSLVSVSLGRASPMKLGGETLVSCFWSVPEQRINFLATMSSEEMNTKLLRKPTPTKVTSTMFNLILN